MPTSTPAARPAHLGLRSLTICAALLLAGCTTADTQMTEPAATPATETVTKAVAEPAAGEAPAPRMTMGNGASNWIQLEGAVRNEKTLTFKEVQIEGNGWLVMHPFEDGKPNGDKYVASTYLNSGTNTDVDITVHKGAATGEMFIVMLHRDLNENQVFDFVFVDDVNVMDKAVFEGMKMIGHAVPSP